MHSATGQAKSPQAWGSCHIAYAVARYSYASSGQWTPRLPSRLVTALPCLPSLPATAERSYSTKLATHLRPLSVAGRLPGYYFAGFGLLFRVFLIVLGQIFFSFSGLLRCSSTVRSLETDRAPTLLIRLTSLLLLRRRRRLLVEASRFELQCHYQDYIRPPHMPSSR